MRFEQAMKALRAGKKVRRSSWSKGEYWNMCDPLDQGTWMKDEKGDYVHSVLNQHLQARDWVVVKTRRTDSDVFQSPKSGDAISAEGVVQVVVCTNACSVTFVRLDLMDRHLPERLNWGRSNWEGEKNNPDVSIYHKVK